MPRQQRRGPRTCDFTCRSCPIISPRFSYSGYGAPPPPSGTYGAPASGSNGYYPPPTAGGQYYYPNYVQDLQVLMVLGRAALVVFIILAIVVIIFLIVLACLYCCGGRGKNRADEQDYGTGVKPRAGAYQGPKQQQQGVGGRRQTDSAGYENEGQATCMRLARKPY